MCRLTIKQLIAIPSCGEVVIELQQSQSIDDGMQEEGECTVIWSWQWQLLLWIIMKYCLLTSTLWPSLSVVSVDKDLVNLFLKLYDDDVWV